MNQKLKEKTLEALSAVVPITAIVLILSVVLVPMELGAVVMFFAGAAMLIVGMGFFQLGAEMAMTPLGEGIGVSLSRYKKVGLIAIITFVVGLIITVSEPDLQVLAEQVPAIDNYFLIVTVAVGVGVFLSTAVLRIIFKISLSTLLIIFYAVLIAASFFIPKEFVAVAFDSGGVTTGPMTVPFIMALGVGLAARRGSKGSSDDSFGLVALSSIGPIITMMILGIFAKPTETVEQHIDIVQIVTTRDVAREFGRMLPEYALEVLISIAPIAIVFMVFQIFSRRYSIHEIKRIFVGMLYTYIGLVLFLCGVNVGFAPLGSFMGEQVGLSYGWVLVPLGALIGYFIVKAEPAIQVLNHQVESVTGGSVSAHSMNTCMSVGVSVSVGLAMLRILIGIPIMYILVPGYVIALVMSRFVPKIFVGIAFDSGGVASGPMTSTFLLPLSIGACTAVGGNLMTDAFGVVALVALTPLIAIQIMGLVYRLKINKIKKQTAAMAADSDEIVILEDDADE